jgi:hypothetical protein
MAWGLAAIRRWELFEPLRAVFCVLSLPLLLIGGCLLHSGAVSWKFYRAEAAFSREIGRRQLIGASRSQVLAFLRHEDVLQTAHSIHPPMPEPPASERSKPIQERSVFRISTPGVSSAQDWCAVWRSVVELHFDRKGKLVRYKFAQEGTFL